MYAEMTVFLSLLSCIWRCHKDWLIRSDHRPAAPLTAHLVKPEVVLTPLQTPQHNFFRGEPLTSLSNGPFYSCVLSDLAFE